MMLNELISENKQVYDFYHHFFGWLDTQIPLPLSKENTINQSLSVVQQSCKQHNIAVQHSFQVVQVKKLKRIQL